MLDVASAFDKAQSGVVAARDAKTETGFPSDCAQTNESKLQRARGEVRVASKLRDGATVLDRLYQSGSAKARVPKGDGFEVVLLNTAGGVTGGDKFQTRIDSAADTTVTTTTQTAERIYRSSGADGRIDTAIEIGEGARVDWLPQETILFDGGRLRRSLTVNMPSSATLLVIEPLVFGRTAMGETVKDGFISDQWRIRRDGELIYADALRVDGAIAETLRADAALGSSLACASLLYCAPDAEDRVDAVRTALGSDGGASAWNGFIAARLAVENGAILRAALHRVVSVLRAGSMPRVWFS